MTTMHDLTPTYDDLCHYADIGRRLTQAAGIPLDTHPPADVVLRALTRWPSQAYAAAIMDMQVALSDLAKANKETRNAPQP